MKVIKQIFIILICYILGDIIARGIKLLIPTFHMPGMIIGMILLFLLLILKIVRIVDISEVSSFLTSNLGFFFIPATVSILRHFEILSENIWMIVMMIGVSSLLSFFAIVYSVKWTLLIQKKYMEKREKAHE
ncbi:MAG: CidA/LrgA family protein [Bacilli bacterium]